MSSSWLSGEFDDEVRREGEGSKLGQSEQATVAFPGTAEEGLASVGCEGGIA